MTRPFSLSVLASLWVAVFCVACDAPELPLDAAPDASDDARDVPFRDVPLDVRDAAVARCEETPLEPWDLSLGSWSTNFGPRGLSDDGPNDAIVNDLAMHDGVLYVAGEFSHAGPVPASNVARWTLARGWSALGDGVPEATSRITVAPDGTVYVATVGPPIGGPSSIYSWDGSDWALIGVTDRGVMALRADVDGTLLAGGYFLAIGPLATPDRFARWDGTAWTAIEQPFFDVAAILSETDRICIGGGGGFGGQVACQERGSTFWEAMPLPAQPGPSYPRPVQAIVRDASDRIVIGGGVYLGTDMQLGAALRWTGAAWETLGAGLSDSSAGVEVRDLARTSDDAIYAVGNFTSVGRPRLVFTFHVARWALERWWDVGGVQGERSEAARAVVADGTTVYVGGALLEAFNAAGSWHAASAIARYDGGDWHALENPGVAAHGPESVSALGVRGSCTAFLSGRFTAIEDTVVGNVAALAPDGSSRAVASTTGFDIIGHPNVLAVGPDGVLYGGGSLWLVGPGPSFVRGPLARVMRGDWEPFGPFEETDIATALAFSEDGILYVGGTFPDEEDGARSHLLSWNGSVWSAVGARPDPQPVVALTVEGPIVHVAEALPDGQTRVSRFDGTWSLVGIPFAGDVQALVLYRGVIHVGGRTDGGGALLMRWDGSTWTSIAPLSASSRYSAITSFAVLGDELVAGGGNNGSRDEPGILVRWTGSDWEELAGGVDDYVGALAFTRDGLLVGGAMDVAGGVPSWGLALLSRPAGP